MRLFMVDQENTKGNQISLDEVKIRLQVEKISCADLFAKSNKLVEFLNYIVEETLSGRTDRLKAVSIAQAVYGRDENFHPQSDNTVRVEAGRLRSRLTEYYAGEGKGDPIVIEVPKGAYRPQFSLRDTGEAGEVPVAPQKFSPTSGDVASGKTVSAVAWPRHFLWVSVAAGLLLVITATASVYWFAAGDNSRRFLPKFTENQEAYALFLVTRMVGRPPHLKARVNAAIELSRQVQHLDPTFGGGVAAEAFGYYTLVLFGHSDVPNQDLGQGLSLARKAIEIDPEFAEGYKSLSRLHLLESDLEAAVEAARLSVDLFPDSGEQLGNLGLVLTVAGHAAEAIAPLEKALERSDGSFRTPYLNYLGIAHFHAGDFGKTIEAINKNRELGGPMGPHMLAYLAAAYEASGNPGRAETYRKLIETDKSGFPLAKFLNSFLVLPEQRTMLLKHLNMPNLEKTAS